MRQSLEARYRGVTPIVFGAKKQILSGFADDVVNKEKGPAGPDAQAPFVPALPDYGGR
jgi:hypothetical protein